MRLSRIKLSGFKSFVDPTTIKFPSNLMGIVGPNGCGKSNIIDAIRWVLGESSAKHLRGDSMADVIFNGSSNRKPVGVASIELTFDNTDGTITGPYAGYSEISVRRVVSRDGTSQYYLNNARCRRKDITHILLGTGLGSHGYSIIEQGMISRLVEAKPEELRAFLEEAAGISKYKERRRETEHRIRHTRENLERLHDLREEIDKQLSHLQKQAKDAERYKTLKAEQRRVNAELLALRLKGLRDELAQHEHAFKEQQLALDAAVAEQRGVETQIEKLRVELGERNDRFNAVQGSYYGVGAQIARLEQSIQHRKDLIQRQRDDLAATDQQLDEIGTHIASDEVELAQLDQVLQELGPGLEEAYSSQRRSQQALEHAEHAMERWRERWEQIAEELASAERSSHVEATRIEQLTAQQERLEKEHEKQIEERAALVSAELEQRVETLVAQEERLGAACDEANRALENVARQILALREQDKRISSELDELRERLQNDKGRLASLAALQEAALGQGSKALNGWLESQNLTERQRLAQELVVEPGWELAVETVLGAYLQAVSVPSIDALASSLIEVKGGGLALIEERGGQRGALAASNARETFSADDSRQAFPAGDSAESLSADDSRERFPAGDSAESFSSADAGREGLLADRVNAPASVAPLLAGVRTSASLEGAIAMRAELGDGESVVTPEGFWIGPHWLRIARSDDPRVGVLVRGEEIKKLRLAIDSATQRVDEVAHALADTRAQLEHLENVRNTAQADANERQQKIAEARTELAASRGELDRVRSRAAALDRSIADLEAEQRTLSAALEQSRSQLEAAAERQQQHAGTREELERQRNAMHEQLTAARAAADADRERAQAIAIQVESRRSSKESASAALARVQSQREQLMRRKRELEQQIESAAAPLEDEERVLVQRLDERLAVEQDLAAARVATEETDLQLREAEEQRGQKQRAVNEIREGADNVRLAVREAQVRAETVNEQFAETGFSLETLLAELPDTANAAEWHETFDRLERRIQRLGAINLAAIDEYQEQSERKRYLDSQFADLSEALETLENAIRKIDRETRARFKETFDHANQGLARIFPRLFGGGHAYLEMDGEDLLESGVTIMARPPGKKISTIHLLSGGEKALTAVALVFSIFELNPAPFCLLDEVDAPLDDANVGRFSDIVREMSERVQFVIITHNKTTMESMHQLTGVTMNEPGVSRLVAVDIDEAVQLAAM